MLMVRYGKSNALYNFFKFQDIAIQVADHDFNLSLESTAEKSQASKRSLIPASSFHLAI